GWGRAWTARQNRPAPTGRGGTPASPAVPCARPDRRSRSAPMPVGQARKGPASISPPTIVQSCRALPVSEAQARAKPESPPFVHHPVSVKAVKTCAGVQGHLMVSQVQYGGTQGQILGHVIAGAQIPCCSTGSGARTGSTVAVSRVIRFSVEIPPKIGVQPLVHLPVQAGVQHVLRRLVQRFSVERLSVERDFS